MVDAFISSCNRWDARFLSLCDFVGSWSEDSSRKVGSVIVGPGNEIRATGYNGLPRGVDASIEKRHSREQGEKYYWFEHAERNAIYNLARSGTRTDGCRIYINHFPCADCTRGIIQSGIEEVRTFPFDKNDERFIDQYKVSLAMFSEAKIQVTLFSREDPLLHNIL